MSILKAVGTYLTTVNPPRNFDPTLDALKSELNVDPEIRFVSSGFSRFLETGRVTCGKAVYPDNFVEINLNICVKTARYQGITDTLAHECRHIWQYSNGIDLLNERTYREMASFSLFLSPTQEERELLFRLGIQRMDAQTDFLAYLMRWQEVDARAYAAWFMHERELGIPYEEPIRDRDLIAELMAEHGYIHMTLISQSQMFRAFLGRMLDAERRIKRAYQANSKKAN